MRATVVIDRSEVIIVSYFRFSAVGVGPLI